MLSATVFPKKLLLLFFFLQKKKKKQSKDLNITFSKINELHEQRLARLTAIAGLRNVIIV